MLEKNDHQLMLEVREGQLQQLSILFERHHLKLYHFLLKFCGNSQWSEDMVQEVFIRILKYASSYKDEGNFIPWIFNIARNVATHFITHEQARLKNQVDVDIDETASVICNPEYLHDLNEQSRHLQKALLALPSDKRELILLSKVKLLTMTDLAKLFDCNLSALKVRLHRAIEMLRKEYQIECEKK